MILITRPKLEAKKLKKKIEDLGHVAHIDSLSKIINFNIDINTNSKRIILISSQRAAKIIIEKCYLRLNQPILVIGDTSHQKLKRAGFSKILYKAKDSDQLLKYLVKNFLTLKKKYGIGMTYLTGSVSNQKFIKSLDEIGFNIEMHTVYKTIFKNSLNHSTIELLKKNKINICLIFSQRNAQQFCNLVMNKNLYSKCKNLFILTLSKNISQVMKKNGYSNVVHAPYPRQSSLVHKLKKIILL